LLAFGKRKLERGAILRRVRDFSKVRRGSLPPSRTFTRGKQCHDQIGRIGDQREDYLLKALRGYKGGERKGYDPAMNEVAQEISDEDAIAHYVAHFK
jgi:hypothetical protein